MANEDFSYKVGLGNVPSYQMSGIPYVTSSLVVPASGNAPLEVSFPNVSKFVTVKNDHATNALKFGFSANGVAGTNYFTLAAGTSYTGELRVRSIFLVSSVGSVGTASVIAGLTGIAAGNLTSNWSGSAGVG